MADKASRGLVVYGDGLMPLVSASHTHLHSLASKASCGFLSLPHSPPSESEDERVVRELAQLLDAHEGIFKKEKVDINSTLECQKEFLVPSISERFMGMRAAIFTTSSCVGSFARDLGFHILQFDQLTKNNHSINDPPQKVPDAFYMASQLLRFLGFQEGKILEKSEFDLVFVHIGAGQKANDLKDNVTGFELEWLNALIGGIMQIAQPGSEIGSRLHFSLVMSYGTVSENEDHNFSILFSQKETNSFFPLLCPSQSYTMKGGSLLKNIRHHAPMLIAQWQEGVTRRDMAQTFSFKEFMEYGANLAVPADRFLHEVAFKLWKAPKYGA